MTTFERYFIADKNTHAEKYNPYYTFSRQRATCEMILHEFGLNPEDSHIINGHVPVRMQEGEKPVKAEGLLFVIDGGISKAYHGRTGIGGYTLISNSHHLALAEHRPFEEVKKNRYRSAPHVEIVKRFPARVQVGNTDIGVQLKKQIQELQDLLQAYREGSIREKQ